ncbi:MAG: hypothetical protein EPN37_07070 [Chitinophagaceae bacterium]|nr:MAG: hypothetical protein EPN37_07070 [Chitinophagaceae bacterium]
MEKYIRMNETTLSGLKENDRFIFWGSYTVWKVLHKDDDKLIIDCGHMPKTINLNERYKGARNFNAWRGDRRVVRMKLQTQE